MSELIENLRTAIETMHLCKAKHERSEWVVVELDSKVVWEGVVESFTLTGHTQAKRCYAWSYQNKVETQYVNMLEIPPGLSPHTAVKTAIVSGYQNLGWTASGIPPTPRKTL